MYERVYKTVFIKCPLFESSFLFYRLISKKKKKQFSFAIKNTLGCNNKIKSDQLRKY